MAGMKYSGIKWIGDIPKEWSMSKYKYFSESRMGETILSEETVEQGIPVYSATESNDIFGFVSSSKLILRKNDFVIPARGNSVGFITIVPDDKATCTQTTICSRNIHDINYKYLYYSGVAYKNDWFRYDGSAIPQITVSQINNNKLVIPSIKEQKLIADFLDEKVDTIDNIICDLDNQIEILGKYKKQLISEAVIKGLNKKVSMKDSGVEWIGSIPKHWNIKLIKNICSLKGRIGWEGLTKDEYISEGPTLITGINFDNGSINWDSCEHVSEWRYNQDKSIQIKNKDLLITKDGTVGKVAIVKDCPEKVTLNSGVLLLRPLNNEYIEKYLYYVLLSNEFWHWFEIENIGNTTIIHLYQNRFAKFKLALPPIDEQKEIVNYLDIKCSEIEEILNSKIKQKEQMEQYKKSVIYEYVTGKKRVEGAEELYG